MRIYQSLPILVEQGWGFHGLKVGFEELVLVPINIMNNVVLRYLHTHEPYERFLGPYQCQHQLEFWSIEQIPHN